MITWARGKSFVRAVLGRSTTTVLVSVKAMQLGLARHGGSQGTWQHLSWTGKVTGVVPSVGSRGWAVASGMGSSWLIVAFERDHSVDVDREFRRPFRFVSGAGLQKCSEILA